MLTKSEQPFDPKDDFKSLPNYESYPFEIKGIEERSFVTKEGEDIGVGLDTGEMYVVAKVAKTRTIKHDSRIYTKFFIEDASLLINLSVAAANMLNLIMSRLTPGALEICLVEDDFIDYCGYKRGSKRLYYKAISELVSRDIIRRKARFMRCYWVNANIIFNGDRTKIKIQ